MSGATKELSGTWLKEARKAAWKAFQETPEPARTVETWRRVPFAAWRLNLLTDANLPTMIGPDSLAPDVPSPRPLPQTGEGEHGGEGNEVAGSFYQDGNRLPAAIALDPELTRKGVVLCSLEEAAERFPELVQPRLNALAASVDFRRFEAANLSQFRGGAFLRVPKGVRVEAPIQIAFAQYQVHPFAFPRVLAAFEEGSEATVVEEHVFNERKAANDARKLSSIAFSEMTLARDAKVKWFYHQALSQDTSHFWLQRAELGQNALLQHYSAFLGGAVHKSELDVRLMAPGARSELRGALFGGKDQLFDPHTYQDHRAPSTTSDLLYRTALKGKARSIYTGLIRVEKNAKGTEAYQQNNNVLLSSGARADSTPVLEIMTDDVHCKHGATVGPMNPDEQFYLESRGLSPDEAMKILLLGFLDPVVGRLPLAELRERVTAAIEKRISQ